jgi:hypothetical protein
MLQGVEDTIKQGRDFFSNIKNDKQIPKPLCPLCKEELDFLKANSPHDHPFYRCINFNCNMTGIARYLEGLKP